MRVLPRRRSHAKRAPRCLLPAAPHRTPLCSPCPPPSPGKHFDERRSPTHASRTSNEVTRTFTGYILAVENRTCWLGRWRRLDGQHGCHLVELGARLDIPLVQVLGDLVPLLSSRRSISVSSSLTSFSSLNCSPRFHAS